MTEVHGTTYQNWLLNSISNDIIEEEMGMLSAVAYGGPFTVPWLNDSAVTLNGINQYIELTAPAPSECPFDIDSCNNGFTLSMQMLYLGNTDYDQYIVSSGGSVETTKGFYFRHQSSNQTLPFR